MPEGKVSAELEAKLLVERESDLEALARLTRLGPYRLRPQAVQDLYTVYLDTKDWALARRAVALRVRRRGEAWEATVKWAGSVDGLIHQRPELNLPLPGPPQKPFALTPELHNHLAAMLAGRKVAPILVTEIHRTPIDVLDASASRCLAEIALDRVYLHAPRKRHPRGERYFEVEVEGKEGNIEDVASITALLRRGRRVQPAVDSKFSRGLHLLYGSAAFIPPLSLELTFADSVAVAARKIVARHLDRLVTHDPGTRWGQEPEPLHNMRVATRRLRAVVRVLGPAFSVALHTALLRELRWLGQLLGAVRDIDVQLQRVDMLQHDSRGNQRAGMAAYVDYLLGLRDKGRISMLEGLDSPRYFRLLRRLEAYAREPVTEVAGESIAELGARAIRKVHKRLRKRGGRIAKRPTAEELHSVRIQSKRMRYVCEFLKPLIGRPGRRFAKLMVELQDLLGAHNDAVVATQFARRFLDEELPRLDEISVRAVSNFIRVNEQHAAESRAAFHRAWERFARGRTERGLEAILEVLR